MRLWLAFGLATLAANPLPGAAAAATDGKKVVACMDAADAAGKFAGTCIGLIRADCEKSPHADVNVCAAKELAFWDARLAASLKTANALLAGYPELVKPQADAQKAWAIFRDKACAIADTVDPGTMPGGSAGCRAEVTAERVFMLRRISASLGEH